MENAFDKQEMMEDQYGFYVYNAAKEVPLTANRIDSILSYMSNYIHVRNKAIKKLEAEGKSTASLTYDRDRALYALGLGERPDPQMLER